MNSLERGCCKPFTCSEVVCWQLEIQKITRGLHTVLVVWVHQDPTSKEGSRKASAKGRPLLYPFCSPQNCHGHPLQWCVAMPCALSDHCEASHSICSLLGMKWLEINILKKSKVFRAWKMTMGPFSFTDLLLWSQASSTGAKQELGDKAAHPELFVDLFVMTVFCQMQHIGWSVALLLFWRPTLSCFAMLLLLTSPFCTDEGCCILYNFFLDLGCEFASSELRGYKKTEGRFELSIMFNSAVKKGSNRCVQNLGAEFPFFDF